MSGPIRLGLLGYQLPVALVWNVCCYGQCGPWKLVHLELKPKHDDHIVTVCGLSQYSVAKVIENILVRFYGLSGETLKSKFLAFCEKVKDKSLEGIMRIPMMLIAACHLWHREDASGQNKSLDTKQSFSVTHLYLELLDQMIQNAARKQSKQGNFVQNPQTLLLSDKEINPSTRLDMLIILRKFSHLCHCIDMLLPFCELAFTDLVSADTKLVFHKGQLERQLGKSQVDLAHRLGLISQAKVRGKYPQPNVSVSFYHKSVQELLAAMYITCGPLDAFTSFCGYCSTIEKVMETANVTMFVVGLDPSLGCRICEHITNIVNSDPDITEYRRTLDTFGRGNDRVRQLYRTQCEWYRELTHVRAVTGDTSPPPSLHVTDVHVYLDHGDLVMFSDSADTVRLTGDLMYSNRDTIVSVTLWEVYPPLQGVIESLPECPNLSALYIDYMSNTENHDLLAAVIPRLTHLTTVRYVGFLSAAADRAAVAAVMSPTQLERIRLEWVILGDDGLQVTDAMTRLRTVVLYHVNMTAEAWDRLVTSLLTLPQCVSVRLRGKDIDKGTVRRIQTSPRVTVTRDDGEGYYRTLEFMTVPSLNNK